MVTINLFASDIDLSVEFPSTWNELTGTEVVEICKQQLLLSAEPDKMKAAIFLFILQKRVQLTKTKLPNGWQQLLNVEECQLYGIELLEFIFKENNLTSVSEKILLNTYHGPAAFSDILCGQFEDAEIFFHQFYKKPEPEALATIAAIFWLPKNKEYLTFSASKNKFIGYDYQPAIKQFQKIEPWRLYAIFYWYHGCRQILPKIFPVMHEPGENSSGPDMLSFTKCIHAGAGPKNGTRDQIRATKLYEFLFDMEQEAVKAKELKELYERKS